MNGNCKFTTVLYCTLAFKDFLQLQKAHATKTIMILMRFSIVKSLKSGHLEAKFQKNRNRNNCNKPQDLDHSVRSIKINSSE